LLNGKRATESNPLFAAYTGPSMNPTLQAPELMEIVPYDGRPVRVGDVIFFRPPHGGLQVVHRIIRVTPEGIRTRGDNNRLDDVHLLQPTDIAGRVVAAWRGQRRRKITGGRIGWLASRWLRWGHVLYDPLLRLLYPVYDVLARRGILAYLLPGRFRPRVVVFQSGGCNHFQLLVGRHAIGHYDARRGRWVIQRPFRLLVDERRLWKDEG
jgi:signal peptidase I